MQSILTLYLVECCPLHKLERLGTQRRPDQNDTAAEGMPGAMASDGDGVGSSCHYDDISNGNNTNGPGDAACCFSLVNTY